MKVAIHHARFRAAAAWLLGSQHTGQHRGAGVLARLLALAPQFLLAICYAGVTTAPLPAAAGASRTYR